MKAVVQRVASASVEVDDIKVSEIGKGLMILLCVMKDDEEKDLEYLVKKCAGLRIFDDADGVMNLNVSDVTGEILVVSQFTLAGNVKKGYRPSYVTAAGHEKATPLYTEFCRRLHEASGCVVRTGVFGADMQVALVNDGPVTIIVDSRQI